MAPLKILLIGPKGGGKSWIANCLSEQFDRMTSQMDCQPTQGVRIIELERNKVSIELWDVSGNQDFESCWPAIMKDVDGVILVYNPDSPLHDSEALLWYEWFIQNRNMDTKQCLVFENSSENKGPLLSSSTSNSSTSIKLSKQMKIVRTQFNIPSTFRSEFDKFIASITNMAAKSFKRI